MIRLLFSILFFCLFAVSGRAAHIIGGEITYECLGYTNGDPSTNSRTYQFVMRIYRDCQGGGADFDSAPFGAFTASVSIYAGNSSSPYTTLYLGPPTETFIDPDPGNPCVIVPGNVCVEQGVYVFPEIDLPIIDDSYFVVYQRCCRNGTISNIVNPGGSGATYFIELTAEAQATCNNSPVFDNFPPAVLCVGEPFFFFSTATDAEGDQLVYELCTPFLGGGLNFDQPDAPNGIAPDPDRPPPYQPVNFVAPNFGPSNPLGVDAMSLNPVTGVLTGTPPFLGQFVVGVCVSEYRNGQLLSTVRRDFQFNVTNCEVPVNASIQADEVLDDGTFLIESCGDTRVEFTNLSGQASFIDVYRWTFDLPDTQLVLNNRDITVDFPGTGEYEGVLALNPGTTCSDSARVLVRIFPEITAGFSYEYDTCIAGPVIFTDESYSGAGPVESWNWNFDDGENSSLQNPAVTYREPGIKNVFLTVADSNGCEATFARQITYLPVPALIILSPSTFVGCAPGEVFFDNLSTPVDETYEVLWDFGDGQTGEAVDITHVFQQPGLYDISLEIISPIGCRTDTTFEQLIRIDPSPTAAFTFSPERLDNFNATATFTNLSENAAYYSWDFNGLFSTAAPDPVYTFPDTGRQEVRLIATHPLGCQDTAYQVIDVEPRVTYFLPNAFTPNGDSVNDLFLGKGFLRGLRQFEMQVWSRWGELLFSTDNPDQGWDGRVAGSGREAPPGAYVCLVRYTGPRGGKVEEKTMITLIR